MPARVSLKAKMAGGGSYFAKPRTNIEFIPSGCKTLDLALGGGWVEGRVANIVGDKSTGKTLLCIEAAANFALKYPKGRIRYCEAESAFDPEYARALGMPIDQVDFGEPIETVEELFADLLKAVESKRHTLFILDSLDALSDQAEMERDMNQGSYGAEKAKKLSQLFRRLVRKMSSANLTLIIVSQVRSKIGMSFGRNTTRSGGRALDFYASQVAYLQHIGTTSKTIGSIKRPVAIELRAKIDKNKVSLPLREAGFTLQFGYGVDDLASCVAWLKLANSLDLIGVKANASKEFVKETNGLAHAEYFATLARVHKAVEERWFEIERRFLPKRQTYGVQK